VDKAEPAPAIVALILYVLAVPIPTLPLVVKPVKVPRLVIFVCAAVDKVPFKAPLTVRLLSVPTEVIFVCAAVVSVPAIFPLTVKPVKVPTDVILGCAAVVSVSAVADSDAGTVVSAIYLLQTSFLYIQTLLIWFLFLNLYGRLSLDFLHLLQSELPIYYQNLLTI